MAALVGCADLINRIPYDQKETYRGFERRCFEGTGFFAWYRANLVCLTPR